MPQKPGSMRGPFSFAALTGGATNTLYIARGVSGSPFVVRCLTELPVSIVDRRMETRLQGMCAAAGLGPAILTNLGALEPPGSPASWRAEEFIVGRTLDRESMRLPQHLRAVGAALHMLHSLSSADSDGTALASPEISVWSRANALGAAADALLAADSRETTCSKHVSLPSPARVVEGAGSWRGATDALAARTLSRLRSLGQQAVRCCISHCDANPGNVLVINPVDPPHASEGQHATASPPTSACSAAEASGAEGAAAAGSDVAGPAVESTAAAGAAAKGCSRIPAVQLIDFEYGAWAPRALDLANVLAEAEFDNSASTLEESGPGRGFVHDPRWALPEGLSAELMSGYGGASQSAQLQAEAEAMLPLVHLTWGLWGVVMAARAGQSVGMDGQAVDGDGAPAEWSYWHYAAVRLQQAAAARVPAAPVSAYAGSEG